MEQSSDQDARDLKAVSATLRGDTDAFRTIVESYEPLLRHLSAKYLRDEDQRYDAVQEIFLKAYRSLEKFDRERRFMPWLYGIAVNYLKTVYRRNRKRTTNEVSYVYPIEDERDNPESRSMQSATEETVRKAVDSLPKSLREVVILYYLEGLSVEEVKEILSIGKENVKSRLHRARKKLRIILEKDATDQDVGAYME